MGGWPALLNLGLELAHGLKPDMVGGFTAPAPEYSLWPPLLKVGAVLLSLLGILLLGVHLLKRFKLVPAETAPLIRVLARHYVAPKQALLLVAVGREQFLLASIQDRLTLLTALSFKKEAEPLEVEELEDFPPPGPKEPWR